MIYSLDKLLKREHTPYRDARTHLKMATYVTHGLKDLEY